MYKEGISMNKPIIIADACANHLGQRVIMEEMIKKAAEIGIDYLKFQSFKADKLNKNWDNYIENHDYYKKHELSFDDHIFIKLQCNKYNIKPLFTVFDLDSAEELKALNIESVKIASPDANNFELIEYVIENFNDVFISTGMHNKREIKKLREFIKYMPTVRLFYCVSKYPTRMEDINFDDMLFFDGFSDHTETLEASKKALDLGMGIIERHFTLGKDLPGRDHKLSSTPDEFKELIRHRDYLYKSEQYKTRWHG